MCSPEFPPPPEGQVPTCRASPHSSTGFGIGAHGLGDIRHCRRPLFDTMQRFKNTTEKPLPPLGWTSCPGHLTQPYDHEGCQHVVHPMHQVATCASIGEEAALRGRLSLEVALSRGAWLWGLPAVLWGGAFEIELEAGEEAAAGVSYTPWPSFETLAISSSRRTLTVGDAAHGHNTSDAWAA